MGESRKEPDRRDETRDQRVDPGTRAGRSDAVRSAWISAGGTVLAAIIVPGAAFAAGLVKPGDTITGRSSTPVPSGAPSQPKRSPSRPTPATQTAAGFSTRRTSGSNPLTLSDGYYADLDTEDTDWDVGYAEVSARFDVSYHGPTTGIVGGGKSDFAIVSQAKSAGECAAATNYRTDLPGDRIKEGLTLCVRTSEKRVARVLIEQFDQDTADSVGLDVTVWDPPVTH